MLNETQLKNHYNGIGGSLAPAILGFDKYKTPLEAYMQLTDEDYRKKCQQEQSECAKWGNLLEPLVASECEKIKGWELESCNDTLVHPKYDFLIAHPDRLIKNIPEDGLEIKTRNQYRDKEYGEEGTDEMLETDMIQCQHYMAVTGRKKWHLAALIGGQKLKFYETERSDELINEMIDILSFFWKEHVLKKNPPEPKNIDDLKLLYPRSNKRAVIATPEIEVSVISYRSHKKTESIAKGMAANEYEKIALYMKDANTLVSPDGQLLLTYDTQDRKAYEVKASSSRVMRLK